MHPIAQQASENAYRMATRMASRSHFQGAYRMDLDDVIQEARIGAWIGLSEWDPGRGTKPETHAVNSARWRIGRAREQQNPWGRAASRALAGGRDLPDIASLDHQIHGRDDACLSDLLQSCDRWQECDDRLLAWEICRAAERLHRPFRDAFLAVVRDGATFREHASQSGVSPECARYRVKIAVRLIKDELQC